MQNARLNNSWYVNFESDEDAQLAYRYLREEVRCFQVSTAVVVSVTRSLPPGAGAAAAPASLRRAPVGRLPAWAVWRVCVCVPPQLTDGGGTDFFV